MSLKVYQTLDFYWYGLSTSLDETKTTSTTSRLGTFSQSLVLSI